MENTPFFSVIVPVYNAEKYIRRSLDSILGQTFTDFEVILIDDGSKDQSAEIIREYTDPRVRLVQQENRGEGGARNRGIQEVQGQWVAFLDADDEWLPEALQRFHDKIVKVPNLEFCYAAYLLKDDSGKESCRSLVTQDDTVYETDYLFDLWQKKRNLHAWIGSITVRYDVLKKTDLFPVGLKMGADRHLWTQLGFIVQKAIYIPKIVTIYHSGIGVSQDYYKALKKLKTRPIYPSWLSAYEEWSTNGKIPEDRRESAFRYIQSTIPVTVRSKGYERNGRIAMQIINRYVSPFKRPLWYCKCCMSYCIGWLGSWPWLRKIGVKLLRR